jgi:hypothetical protein
MNPQPSFILFATMLVLSLVQCSGTSAAQSKVPLSPAQDGTSKPLAVIAGVGTLENDDYEISEELRIRSAFLARRDS